MTLLSSCATRQKIDGLEIYLFDKIDTDICNREPRLKKLGIFRRVNDKQEKFLSFCKPEVKEFMAISSKDGEVIFNLLIR